MEHAADEEVKRGLMVGDSFASSQGFISLHVWLCLTRLRQEGSESKEVQQVSSGRPPMSDPSFSCDVCGRDSEASDLAMTAAMFVVWEDVSVFRHHYPCTSPPPSLLILLLLIVTSIVTITTLITIHMTIMSF